MWKAKITSPVGELLAVASEESLCGLYWPAAVTSCLDATSTLVSHHELPIFANLKTQLDEYFLGDLRKFDLDLAPAGTEFQREAWAALLKIPYGETRSYSEQAATIGRPKAVRAIGAANGRNPISIVVPCHRVVGKNGSLTGFAGGVDVKQRLLDLEKKHFGGNAK